MSPEEIARLRQLRLLTRMVFERDQAHLARLRAEDSVLERDAQTLRQKRRDVSDLPPSLAGDWARWCETRLFELQTQRAALAAETHQKIHEIRRSFGRDVALGELIRKQQSKTSRMDFELCMPKKEAVPTAPLGSKVTRC